MRARPPGRWDRVRRGARRHRVALGAVPIIAVAAEAVLAGILRYEGRIRETRDLVGRQSEEARRQAEAARHARYIADLRQARRLIEDHHARRALAVLERHRPGPGEADLRGFAWHYLMRQADASRRTLAGFVGSVYSVAFSPGGDRLAAAGGDGLVRIWETDSWGLRLAFRADRREANAATFSPDGTMLATVGDEGSLRLWDADTGRCRWERPAHRGDAGFARFTRDGRRILTTGRTDGQFKLWDVASGTELGGFRAGSTDLVGIAASCDEEVRRWLSIIAAMARLPAPPIQDVALSHDDRVLALALETSGSVLFVDVPNLRVRHELRGHRGGGSPWPSRWMIGPSTPAATIR